MNAKNLLFVWTDEQRHDALGAAGNPDVSTPNLDRLAAQSVMFETAYCTSPVCTPSRGCLMTGLWAHEHGAVQNNVPLRADATTLAEYVGDDYVCAYLGKWHLGDEVFAQHGWDRWSSFEDEYIPHYSAGRDRAVRSDYHWYLRELGYPPDRENAPGGPVYSRHMAACLPVEHTKARWLGRTAASEISALSELRRPWMMSVNFLEPHMPFYGPLNGRYDPSKLSVSRVFNRDPSEPLPASYRGLIERHAAQGFDGQDIRRESGWRRLLANYYGLVEMVDGAVGDILAALERSGQAENTVVVFTSDHGEMMGDHRLVGKGVMFEHSARVPLLIKSPDLLPGRVSTPFSQIDLPPTILELIGAAVPPTMSGSSHATELRAGGSVREDDVLVQWFARETAESGTLQSQDWRGLVTADRWKLGVCGTEQTGLLFDLTADPDETRNLFSDDASRARRESLTRRLREKLIKIKDPFVALMET